MIFGLLTISVYQIQQYQDQRAMGSYAINVVDESEFYIMSAVCLLLLIIWQMGLLIVGYKVDKYEIKNF